MTVLAVVLCLAVVGVCLTVHTAAITAWAGRARPMRHNDRPGLRLTALPTVVLIACVDVIIGAVVAAAATFWLGPWFGVVGAVLSWLLLISPATVLAWRWAVADLERAAPVVARINGRLDRLAPVGAVVALWGSLAAKLGIPDGDEIDPSAEDEPTERVGEDDLHASVEGFGETIVREVMVPRTDMVLVNSDFRRVDALEIALAQGFSRLPVLGEDKDDIVGVVFAKDLMKANIDDLGDRKLFDTGADGRDTSVVRPPIFVPETKRVSSLLREMQVGKFHLAVVIDEYGGTAGLITLEDIIEELVGEIADEYDPDVEPIIARPDGSHRVSAAAPLDLVNEELGLALPEGDWNTLGGLVFDRFGRLPMAGEWAEIGGCTMRVEKVAKRRIVDVVVIPPNDEDPTNTDDPRSDRRSRPPGHGQSAPSAGSPSVPQHAASQRVDRKDILG